LRCGHFRSSVLSVAAVFAAAAPAMALARIDPGNRANENGVVMIGGKKSDSDPAIGDPGLKSRMALGGPNTKLRARTPLPDGDKSKRKRLPPPDQDKSKFTRGFPSLKL